MYIYMNKVLNLNLNLNYYYYYYYFYYNYYYYYCYFYYYYYYYHSRTSLIRAAVMRLSHFCDQISGDGCVLLYGVSPVIRLSRFSDYRPSKLVRIRPCHSQKRPYHSRKRPYVTMPRLKRMIVCCEHVYFRIIDSTSTQ